MQEKDTQFELCICLAVASDTYIDSIEIPTRLKGADVTE